MEYDEQQLRRMQGKIVRLGLGSGKVVELIKGRLSSWNTERLVLTGDALVANPLEPPDDLGRVPEGVKATRLGPNEKREIAHVHVLTAILMG